MLAAHAVAGAERAGTELGAAVGVSRNWLGVIGDDVTVSAQITLMRTDDGDAG